MLRLIALMICLPTLAHAQSVSVLSPPILGQPIDVQITTGPGSPMDWVGVYKAGTDDRGNYLQWLYLNGTNTPPESGLTTATIRFPAMPAGTYNLRFFANGGYSKLAMSATLNIGATGAAPLPPGALLLNGDSNTSETYVAGEQNWSNIVAKGLGVPQSVNMAVAGKYSDGVILDVPQMLSLSARLCAVMIGTNDMAASVQYSFPVESAQASYLTKMRNIITPLKSGCGRVVILSPILPAKVAEVSRMESWVAGLRTLCAELGVTFLDVFHYMQDLAATKPAAQFDQYYLVPGVDFYHLSPAGHAMLADFVLRSITVP